MTGRVGPEAAAQWVLDRPHSTTQWSIVKQGSSGSVLCSRQLPALYNQPGLQVLPSTQFSTLLTICMHQVAICATRAKGIQLYAASVLDLHDLYM